MESLSGAERWQMNRQGSRQGRKVQNTMPILACHDSFGEFPTSFNFANKKFSTADMVSQSVIMLAIKYRTFPKTLE